MKTNILALAGALMALASCGSASQSPSGFPVIMVVGESTAKEIARYFRDIDTIAAASAEQLLEVPDVGTVIAESVHAFFQDERHIFEVRRLNLCGL